MGAAAGKDLSEVQLAGGRVANWSRVFSAPLPSGLRLKPSQRRTPASYGKRHWQFALGDEGVPVSD